jgi:hypothetical protein
VPDPASPPTTEFAPAPAVAPDASPARRRHPLVGLWLRVYVLVFVLYQLIGVVLGLWWIISTIAGGAGPSAVVSSIGVYLLMVVPAGFGVGLVVSLPLALAWAGLAKLRGWPLEPPPKTATPSVARCLSCGYEIAGLPAGPCPECGAAHPNAAPLASQDS